MYVHTFKFVHACVRTYVCTPYVTHTYIIFTYIHIHGVSMVTSVLTCVYMSSCCICNYVHGVSMVTSVFVLVELTVSDYNELLSMEPSRKVCICMYTGISHLLQSHVQLLVHTPYFSPINWFYWFIFSSSGVRTRTVPTEGRV